MLSTLLTLAAVIGLFFWCCPPTISRFVWAIIVNAIQRSTFWPRTHVGIEILKRLNPAHTDGYTPPAIVLVWLASRIQTTVFHVVPCTIFYGIPHTMSRIRQVVCAPFRIQTPAAFGVSATKHTGFNNCAITTITGTPPVNAFTLAFCWGICHGDDHESAKPLPRKVLEIVCTLTLNAATTLCIAVNKALGWNNSTGAAFAQAFPIRFRRLALDMGRAISLGNNRQVVESLTSKILEFIAVLRGSIEGHREPPVLGVTSRDVQASPAQSIGDFASPLYHFGASKSILGAK